MLKSPDPTPLYGTPTRPVTAPRLGYPAVLHSFRVPLLAGAALLLAGCASDKPTGPPASAQIKIMDTVFLPPIVIIDPGETLEWINRSKDHRTVTSGTGPGDSEAGMLFDIDLAGYKPGQPDGGHYRRTFTEPDTIHYFSRLAPAGFGETISGTIIIR